jgi:hypothetical protein
MATAIKLRSDIKKYEAAIKSKATPAKFKEKLQNQLQKAKSDLQELKSGKQRKAAPAKKAAKKSRPMTAAEKLKEKVKKTPSLARYRNSGVDLVKDADQPALKTGRRVSQGIKGNQFTDKKNAKGKVYYEYRVNRLDIKQPPKRYPKLEKGGYMADGGKIKNNYSFKTAKDIWEMWDFKQKQHFLEDHADEITNSGYNPKSSWMMIAKSKSFEELDERVKTAITHHLSQGQYASGGYMAKGGEPHRLEEPMMASGGETKGFEEGLKDILDDSLEHLYKGLNKVEQAVRYLEVKGQGGTKTAFANKIGLPNLKDSIDKIEEYATK